MVHKKKNLSPAANSSSRSSSSSAWLLLSLLATLFLLGSAFFVVTTSASVAAPAALPPQYYEDYDAADVAADQEEQRAAAYDDECSGHGRLNIYSICVCESGWTGQYCDEPYQTSIGGTRLVQRNSLCDGGLTPSFDKTYSPDSSYDGFTRGAYTWVAKSGELFAYASAKGDSSRVWIAPASSKGQFSITVQAQRIGLPYDPSGNTTLTQPDPASFNSTSLDTSSMLIGYSPGDSNNAAVCTDRPTAFTSFTVKNVGTYSTYSATFTNGAYDKISLCVRIVAQGEALFKVKSLVLDCIPDDPNAGNRSLGNTVDTLSALVVGGVLCGILIFGTLISLCASCCVNSKRQAAILARFHAKESDDSVIELYPGDAEHGDDEDGGVGKGVRKPLIPNARSGRPGEHPELIPVVDERHKDPWLDEMLPDGRAAQRRPQPFGFDFGAYTLGYDINDKHDRCMLTELQKKVRGLISKLPLKDADNGGNEALLRTLYARTLGFAMMRDATYQRGRRGAGAKVKDAIELVIPIFSVLGWVFSCCGSRETLQIRKGWAFTPVDMIKDLMLYFCVWMECGSMQNSGHDFVRLVFLAARRDPNNLRVIRDNFETVTHVLEHAKLVKRILAVRGMDPLPPDFYPNMGDFSNFSLNPNFYEKFISSGQGIRAFEEPESDTPQTPFARIFHLKPLQIDSMRYPLISHPDHVRGRRRQAVQKLEQAAIDEWIADCGAKFRCLRTYRTHRVTTNQLYGLWTYTLNAAPVAWIGFMITIIEIRVVWGDEVPIYMYAILFVLARVIVIVMEILGHYWTRAPEPMCRERVYDDSTPVFDAECVLEMSRRIAFVAVNLAVTMILDVLFLLRPMRDNIRKFSSFPFIEKILFVCTQALLSIIGSTLIGSLCTPFTLSLFALVRKAFFVYRCKTMEEVVQQLDKAEVRFLQTFTRLDPETDKERGRVAFTKVLRLLIKDAYHTDCMSPEFYNATMESLRITDRVPGDYLSGKRETFDRFKRILLSRRWQFDYSDEFRRRLAHWISGLRHPYIPPMYNVLSSPGVSTMCPSARETVAWFPREARDLLDLAHAIRKFPDEWVFFCKRVLLDYETTRAQRDQRALGHMLSIFGVHRYDPESHEMDKIVNDPRCKPTHDHRGQRLNTACSKMVYDSLAKNIGILRFLNGDQHTEVFDSMFYIDRKYFEALRRWMSARIQSLSRTIRGFSTTWKALSVLCRIQNPQMSKKMSKIVAEDKFQFVISFQDLGETIKGSRWEKHPSGQQLVNQQNCLDLLDAVCNTPVDLVTVLRRDTRYFSVRYRTRRINGNVMLFLQRKLKLPGDFLFGNGKSDNQSQMLLHVKNLLIQAVDVNQHGSPEEQMKLPLVAEEFNLDKRVAIIGFSQYIFTDGWSAVGTVAANNERTFNATTQRGLDIVGLRTHYGQPDLMAFDYVVGLNGESLSDFVSEDTPKGLTMHLYNLRVRHVDYITCGKGRDLDLPTTNRFSLKISAGGGEIGTTELFRTAVRHPHVGLFKRWVLFHTVMGFFTSQYIIVWGIIVFLIGHVALTVVNWFNTKINDYEVLADYADVPWYIFISMVLVVPAMITYMMESGFFTGFNRFVVNLIPMVLFQTFTMFTLAYGFGTGLAGTGKRHASGRTLGLDHFRLAQIKAWYRDSHLVVLGFFIFMCFIHLVLGGSVLVLWSTFLLIGLVTCAFIFQNPRTIPLFHSVTATECTTNTGNFWHDMNTWRFWNDEKTGLEIPIHRQQSFKNTVNRFFTTKYAGDVFMFFANVMILATLLIVSYPFRPLADPDHSSRFSYYAEIRSFGVPPGQDFRLEGALPADFKESPELRHIRLAMGENTQRGKPASRRAWAKTGLTILVFTGLWALVLVLIAICYIIFVVARALFKCIFFCKKKKVDTTLEGEDDQKTENEEEDEDDELPNLDKFKTPSLASDATETSVVLINSELEYAEGPAPWEETDYSILVQERNKGKNPWKPVNKTQEADMDETDYDMGSEVSQTSLPWQKNGQGGDGGGKALMVSGSGGGRSKGRGGGNSGNNAGRQNKMASHEDVVVEGELEGGYGSDSPPFKGKDLHGTRRMSHNEGGLSGALANRGRRPSAAGSEHEYAGSESRLLPSEDGDDSPSRRGGAGSSMHKSRSSTYMTEEYVSGVEEFNGSEQEEEEERWSKTTTTKNVKRGAVASADLHHRDDAFSAHGEEENWDGRSEAQTGTHVSLPTSSWESDAGGSNADASDASLRSSHKEQAQHLSRESVAIVVNNRSYESANAAAHQHEQVEQEESEEEDSDHSFAETITQTLSEVSPRGGREHSMITKKKQKKKIIRKIVKKKKGKKTMEVSEAVSTAGTVADAQAVLQQLQQQIASGGQVATEAHYEHTTTEITTSSSNAASSSGPRSKESSPNAGGSRKWR